MIGKNRTKPTGLDASLVCEDTKHGYWISQDLLGNRVAKLLPLCVTARELIRVLKQDGWFVKDQKGSHLQMPHPIKRGKVTIPIHGGDIPKGTLHSIFKQAQLK